MLKTGDEYLEKLKDGRTVYIGSERVDDVARHPAFRNAARTVAALYDHKRASYETDGLGFVEGNEAFSAYYLPGRSAADLALRTRSHKDIADFSFGQLGRSPDYVASFVTGMTLNPDLFGPYRDNVLSYYDFMRRNDIYAAHAVVPPAASRDPAFYQRIRKDTPTLRIVGETDAGLIVNGMKMLASGAILADEIWIGNVIPLAPENKLEAVTFAVPVATPGLSLWSRKPFEPGAQTPIDNPLAWRFDETDAVLLFDNVLVPWERVFVKDDPVLSRALYIETGAHAYGNHQAGVRFLAKLQLIVGLAQRIAAASGSDVTPATREVLGRLASQEALLAGLIEAQISACEPWPEGYVTYNRRFMYAGLNWCSENYSGLVDTLRELCGGSVFQMPANATLFEDEGLKALFDTYWQTPNASADERYGLFRLAWDLVGSEFAGRHLQYEKFFAGASFIVRGHNYREAPWPYYDEVVTRALA